jgi:hypothetical protein
MHIMKLTAVFLALALAAQAGQAAGKLRVLDKGLDGNQRSYLVSCPDGSLSTVVQTFNTPATRQENLPPPNGVTPRGMGTNTTNVQVTKVCIFAGKGERVCRASWDLDEAAKASCQ